MELRVLSDDGDVLRMEVVTRNVQSEAPPRFESLEQLLGPSGYARRVLLSLAETRFIDSAGLSWLVLSGLYFCCCWCSEAEAPSSRRDKRRFARRLMNTERERSVLLAKRNGVARRRRGQNYGAVR